MARRIALALAAVSMLVAVLVLLRHREERVARANPKAARLPAFDDRKVAGFVLAARGAEWRFVRRSARWRIVAPVDDVADSRAVEALIGAASRAPIVRTLASPAAPSTYGLEPPVARLTVEGETTRTLELGDVAPTGDALFARLDGAPDVLLLGLPDAAPLAELDPASLRERGLVDMARSAIVGIEIAPSRVRLARESGDWWITSPQRFPAAPAAVDKLLEALYTAGVIDWDDVSDPAETRYGLGPNALRITLRSESHGQTIALGAPAGNGNLFVTSEGRRTILIADVVPPASFPAELSRFRDPRLTNVNRYDVARFDYASGGLRLSATRKDEARWTTDTGGAMPAERVYLLLVALLAAETTGWSNGELQEKPTATLSYVTAKAGAAGKVSFAGDRATWDAVPGVVFRLSVPPPPVPAQADAP